MLPLGTAAPPFRLPDFDGRPHALEDFAVAPALLVAFVCNHCPFVQHLRGEFAASACADGPRRLAIVAISSNDLQAYPQDGPEAMRREAAEFGYGFPYLLDESQAVAKAYRAACTPDFYLFDAAHRLVYRGQFDASRPGNGKPVTGADLRAAVEATLGGGPVIAEQFPSLGCNIKWRKGNAPEYAAG
jgi:peroxiredoxin